MKNIPCIGRQHGFLLRYSIGESGKLYMMLSSSKLGTDGCVKIIVDTIREMEALENE